MPEDQEKQDETTESTPPDDDSEGTKADDDAKADQESKESFPASDPPSW